MWLFLALIGHIGNALVVIADKASVEKKVFGPKTLAFIAGVTNAAAFLLMPWFLQQATVGAITAAVLSGMAFVAGLLFYFWALDRDEVSRVVPSIGSLVPVFTFFLSFWILGERLEGEFLGAFLLLVAGGVMIEFRSLLNFIDRNFITLLSGEILAAFLFALSSVLLKYSFEVTDDISAFLWSRFGFVGASLPLLLFLSVRSELALNRIRAGIGGSNWWFGGSRILGGIAPLVLTAAMAFGSVTLVSAVQGAQYGFLFILAILFSRRWPKIFGEKITKSVIIQKSVATIFIIAGLYLLT